jgi:hypothetical protein
MEEKGDQVIPARQEADWENHGLVLAPSKKARTHQKK